MEIDTDAAPSGLVNPTFAGCALPLIKERHGGTYWRGRGSALIAFQQFKDLDTDAMGWGTPKRHGR